MLYLFSNIYKETDGQGLILFNSEIYSLLMKLWYNCLTVYIFKTFLKFWSLKLNKIIGRESKSVIKATSWPI